MCVCVCERSREVERERLREREQSGSLICPTPPPTPPQHTPSPLRSMGDRRFALAAQAGKQLLARGNAEAAVPYLNQALQHVMEGGSLFPINEQPPALVDKNKRESERKHSQEGGQHTSSSAEEIELPRKWQAGREQPQQEEAGQEESKTAAKKTRKGKATKSMIKRAEKKRKSKTKKGHVAPSDDSSVGTELGSEAQGQTAMPLELQQLALHRLLGRSFLALGNMQMAGQHHEAELRIAKDELNDPLRTALAYGNMGTVFAGLGSMNEAIKCFEKQLHIGCLIKHNRLQLLANESLGAAYRQACLSTAEAPLRATYLQQAESYFGAAAKVAAKEGMHAQLGKLYGRLAALCEQVHELDRAELWYKKRLAHAEKRSDRPLLSRTLCNLGNVYRAQGRLSRALKCYRRDLKVCRKLGDRRGEAITRFNMGTCHQAAGDADGTIECLQQHLDLAREIGDSEQQKASHLRLGHVFAAAGRFELSLQHFHAAQQLAAGTHDERVLELAGDGIADVTKQIRGGRHALTSKEVAARLANVPTDQSPMHKKSVTTEIEIERDRERQRERERERESVCVCVCVCVQGCALA